MEEYVKIQAIFDALDQDFPKKALHLCEKAMKKHPESEIFQALNILSLFRAGQQKKARKMSEILRKNMPTDENVLNVLQIVFKELNMANEMIEMFENAIKKNPGDEKLAKNWFFSMVKTNNIVGQQKAAMNLQKAFGKRKYYYWSVMSLQLLKMVKMSDSEVQLFKTLAYRLIMKMVEETNGLCKLSSSEELHLYINVLLSYDKIEDAVDVLENDLYKHFIDVDLFRLKLDLLFKLEKWMRLFSQCRDYIDHGNSDWKVFHMQIVSAVNLSASDVSSSVILELVNYYKEKKQKFQSLRNLHLAFLKLSFMISLDNVIDDKLHSCIQYFETFGTKMCCFEDLRLFVEKLRKKEQNIFLVSIRDFCDKAKSNETISKRNYVEILKNTEKFEYFVNYYELKDEKMWIAFSSRLVEEYENSLFLDNSLSMTDNQYGDDFLILSVHALFNVFFISNKQSYLIQAILLLELGLLHSKHNFQFRLLLVRLYSMIGAFSLAFFTYKSLLIKQIQYDTLSYIFLTKCSNYYPSKSLHDELMVTKSIYISNIREIPEVLALAYENCSYSNIENFIEFGVRVNNSIWRHILKQELLHLSYLINDKIFDQIIENNGFTQEKYYDNRDFNIMSDFGIYGNESVLVKSRITSMPDENWLKIHNFKMSFLCLLSSGTLEDIKMKSKSDEWLLCESKFDTLSKFETQMISLLRIFLCLLVDDDQKVYNVEESKLKEWVERNLVVSFLNIVDYDHIVLEHLVFLFESCKSILLFENFVKRFFKTQKDLYVTVEKLKETVKIFYNDIISFVSSLKKKISVDATEFIDLFEPNFSSLKIDKHFIWEKVYKINDSRKNSLDNLNNITMQNFK
ncbi:hypothetical protein PORY_001392 [Pneumocystis oryctolagi]|uniref:Uncharacterized protein n=1 Tax=Pneumocystis oryctolagi TaxID=42067 RepID=A0ACB7CBU8_9ASCO|nr:hypothetical protein PORY_001392 [Pneumocystis oryctolagi]